MAPSGTGVNRCSRPSAIICVFDEPPLESVPGSDYDKIEHIRPDPRILRIPFRRLLAFVRKSMSERGPAFRGSSVWEFIMPRTTAAPTSARSSPIRFIAPWLALIVAVVVCDRSAARAASPVEPTVLGRARIAPSVVHLAAGQIQQFKAVMLQTRLAGATMAKEVTWSVNDIVGGNDTVGTITASGLYTAPAQAPRPREVHIGARVPNASNHFLWATILFPGEGPAYQFISEWTESVAHPDHLKDPHCVALDSAGNLLIADYDGSKVHRYTTDGKYLGELSYGVGEMPGYVIKPRVVQTDRDGAIFVSDQKKDKPRIQVFSPSGKFLYMFADKGIGPGQLLRAHGLAFDSQQRLFVVDVDAMRVNVYSHAGKFLYTWGKDGANLTEFNAPHGIALDGNDDVFVVGYYGPCQKFTADGTLLRVFAEPDPPDSAVFFHSICSDRWGNIYLMVRGMGGYGGKVEDTEGNHVSVMKYNNNGDYVASLTLNVKGHAENWATVDKNGDVYAIYMGDERMGVEHFSPR